MALFGSASKMTLVGGIENSASSGGGGTVTSVSGTPNQIDSTGGTTPVLSLSNTIVLPGTLTVPTGSSISTTGTGTIAATSVPWSGLTNALANLTLNNANFFSTFNQTSAVNWTWANTAAATAGTSQSSPIFNINGTYWTGAASAVDGWTIQDVVANGTNGTSTLTFTHSGTTGVAAAKVNAGVIISAGTVDGLVIINSNQSPYGLMINNTTFGSGDTKGFGIVQLNSGTTQFYNNNINFLSVTTSGICLFSSITISDSAPNIDFTFQNTTAATSGTSQSSPLQAFTGKYWDGAASQIDMWTIQDVIANGTNGTSTFAFTHSGSSGSAAVSVPLLNIGGTDAGISRLGAASLALGNGAAGDFTGALKLGNEILTSAAPTVAAAQVGLGSTTATTANTGANGAPPAQVAGYLIINVAGTIMKIPYYTN